MIRGGRAACRGGTFFVLASVRLVSRTFSALTPASRPRFRRFLRPRRDALPAVRESRKRRAGVPFRALKVSHAGLLRLGPEAGKPPCPIQRGPGSTHPCLPCPIPRDLPQPAHHARAAVGRTVLQRKPCGAPDVPPRHPGRNREKMEGDHEFFPQTAGSGQYA